MKAIFILLLNILLVVSLEAKPRKKYSYKISNNKIYTFNYIASIAKDVKISKNFYEADISDISKSILNFDRTFKKEDFAGWQNTLDSMEKEVNYGSDSINSHTMYEKRKEIAEWTLKEFKPRKQKELVDDYFIGYTATITSEKDKIVKSDTFKTIVKNPITQASVYGGVYALISQNNGFKNILEHKNYEMQLLAKLAPEYVNLRLFTKKLYLRYGMNQKDDMDFLPLNAYDLPFGLSTQYKYRVYGTRSNEAKISSTIPVIEIGTNVAVGGYNDSQNNVRYNQISFEKMIYQNDGKDLKATFSHTNNNIDINEQKVDLEYKWSF